MLATGYYGFLETIRKTGVDIVTTRDLNHSVWWMIAMHGYLGKEHYPKHRKYFSVKEQAVGMLSAVSGIGEKRATKVLEKYNIVEICTAHNLHRSIEGLSELQSEKLKKVLRYRS